MPQFSKDFPGRWHRSVRRGAEFFSRLPELFVADYIAVAYDHGESPETLLLTARNVYILMHIKTRP